MLRETIFDMGVVRRRASIANVWWIRLTAETAVGADPTEPFPKYADDEPTFDEPTPLGHWRAMRRPSGADDTAG